LLLNTGFCYLMIALYSLKLKANGTIVGRNP